MSYPLTDSIDFEIPEQWPEGYARMIQAVKLVEYVERYIGPCRIEGNRFRIRCFGGHPGEELDYQLHELKPEIMMWLRFRD